MAEGRRETLGAGRAVGSGFRVFLTISGLRCRAEGTPRERSLAAFDGVRSVGVSSLGGRACIELLALQERLIDLPKLCERLCRAKRLEAGESS